MSGPQPEGGDRSLAAELRLRPERPRVTRISRKVLIGLGTAASVSVLGLTYWALQSHGVKPESQNLYNTQNQNIADGVASLPSNYGDLPKPAPQLGPPLPGDLGPPILHAEQGSNTPSGTNAANQQLIQEQDSARTSSLFVQTASASTALQQGQTGSVMPEQSKSGTDNQPVSPSSDQNSVSERTIRRAHGQLQPADARRVALHHTGRHSHSRGPHHRHRVGPPRPDHRPGDGKRL